MQGIINPRIIGASVVGFALVLGAFTYQSMSTSDQRYNQIGQTGSAAEAAPRVSIAVSDDDGNGIEDWRDEFVTTKPVVLDQTNITYEGPDTLTGQMGINFMQDIIRSRGYGAFGNSEEEVISKTIETLAVATEQELYDTPDITILQNWEEADIRNYGNTVAATVYRHSIPNMESELKILHNILSSQDVDRVTELKTLAAIYKNYRDDTLQIPVPAFLVKEHLDLINTYSAVYNDIEAMTLALEDPAQTLLRLKRYEDDVTGMAYAFQNMFIALVPYANIFTAEDPATLFTIFSPDYQIQ